MRGSGMMHKCTMKILDEKALFPVFFLLQSFAPAMNARWGMLRSASVVYLYIVPVLHSPTKKKRRASSAFCRAEVRSL